MTSAEDKEREKPKERDTEHWKRSQGTIYGGAEASCTKPYLTKKNWILPNPAKMQI